MTQRDIENAVFGNVAGGNVIGDDERITSYAEVLAAIKEMSPFFEEDRVQQARCVCVSLSNNISHVTILLSLLIRKINFFLLSGNATANPVIPCFCDTILELPDQNENSSTPAGGMELRKNTNFIDGSNVIKPASGLVFFSTSGTTGRAKFVYYQSHKLLQNAKNCAELLGLSSNHRVLVPVPINHMYGLGAGLLPAVLSGAHLCLIQKNNIIRLYDKLVKFKPDVTLITPTVCKTLLFLGKNLSARTLFLSGGDRLNRETYLNFEARYGKLINLYGCTEMGAMASSAWHDASQEDRWEGIVKPLDQVQITIGESGKGELLCKHDAGFEGYVDETGNLRSEQTGPTKWFKTKDLAEQVGKDMFRVIGRTDYCINRNGFLVALQQVEAMMDELFGQEIKQVVLLTGKKDTMAGSALVAVCQLSSDSRLDEATMKRACKEKMLAHQVPDEYYFVPDIPKLSNGKPDRIRLTAQYAEKQMISDDCW